MRGEKKAQNPQQNKNADFLGLSPASQQVPAGSQRQSEPRGPSTALALVPAHLDLGLLAKPKSLLWGAALTATV